MGMVVKHIQKHPSGRALYRRKFPDDLRSIIGKREHKVPLGLQASPGFLARYEEAASGYDATVTAARRKLEGAFDVLDRPVIAFLAESYRVQALEDDDASRWDLEERALHKAVGADLAKRGGPFVDSWEGRERERWPTKKQETLDWVLPAYRSLKAAGDLEGIVKLWRDDALEQAESSGYLVDVDAPEFGLLCRALNDAGIAAGEAEQRRLDGEEVPTPPVPVPPAPELALSPLAANRPLVPMFDAYAAAQGMTPGVRVEWRRYIERLISFLGHDDAALLTAEKVRAWRDQLLSETNGGRKKRQPVTVRDKYISSLRATLGWAVQEGQLSKNVAAEVTVRVPKKVKLRDRDLTKAEAIAILSATLQPSSRRLSEGYALAKRWIPWLAAYTGGRVNEFSQLRGADVLEVEGIWVVNITPDAGTVKAKEARVVPLHQHLIDQGFLDMVNGRGPGPLFYDPNKQRVLKDSNRHFKKVGERLADWVRKEVGITDPDVQPNHAWRHTFKTMSHLAGIEERVADAIQGHAPSTTGRRYGGVPLKAKADAIAKLPRFDVPGV